MAVRIPGGAGNGSKVKGGKDASGVPITKELPVEGVCRSLGVDPEAGLEKAEAKRRRRRFGPNMIYDARRESLFAYAWDAAFDLMLLILILTAATASAFGERVAYAVVIPVLAVNIILRTLAYIRAKRYLEACPMSGDFMPDAAVRRDGKVSRIDARGVVKGDIVCLRAGDVVPADCRLISSRGLYVFEKHITGVGGAVGKDSASEAGASPVSRTNTVYAGSYVTSGEGVAVVTHTGADTLAVRTKGYLKAARGGTLKLTALLEKYSRRWGAALTLLAFFVTVLDIFVGRRGLYEVFFLGLSLAASSMCEFYPATGDIAAARGIMSLKRRAGVSVRGVRAIETLYGLDAIITHADGIVSVDGVEADAYFFDGEVRDVSGAEEKDKEDFSLPDALLRYAKAVTTGEDADAHVFSDAAKTLRDYIKETDAGSGGAAYAEGELPMALYGTADGISFDTRLLHDKDGYMSVSCGSADAILPSCAFVRAGGKDSPLTDAVRAGIGGFVSHHERRGGTAVAVTVKRTPFSSPERIAFTQTDMTLVGVIILYRPLAPGACEAAHALREAGIRVVLTGSGSETAKLADRAGIISGPEDILTARDFAAMTEAGRAEAASKARLLLGFDAREKAAFAALIRKAGGAVAYVASPDGDMTGELSMLGAVGAGFVPQSSPVTLKMSADAVLPEAGGGAQGLAAVASAVAHARRIYGNISNTTGFLLTSQTARIFAVILTVILGTGALPAEQVLLWGLIYDFFAVLVLTREPPERSSLSLVTDVCERLSHPFSGLLPTALPGFVWAAVTVAVPLLYGGAEAAVPSVIFVSVLLSLVVVCGEYRSSYPAFSRKRQLSVPALLFAAAVAAAVVLVTVSSRAAALFGIIQPDAKALIVSVIPALVLLLLFELGRFAGGTGNKGTEKDNNKE